MRIALTVLAFLLIIVTLIFSLNLKKELNKEKVSREVLLKKVKVFNILTILAVSLSFATIIYNYIDNATFISSNNDIEKYSSYLEQYRSNSDIHTELKSFPEKIEAIDVVEFAEFNRTGVFDGSYFIYLVYRYNEKEYKGELERIKSLSIEERKNENELVYIISDDKNNTKEYVLFDEENHTVSYVFNQLFENDELNVNKKYFIK